jgi:hypothetical protein
MTTPADGAGVPVPPDSAGLPPEQATATAKSVSDNRVRTDDILDFLLKTFDPLKSWKRGVAELRRAEVGMSPVDWVTPERLPDHHHCHVSRVLTSQGSLHIPSRALAGFQYFLARSARRARHVGE